MLTSNKRIIKLILILIIPIFFACSDSDDELNNDNVLIINDYKMTKTEFLAQCVEDMEYSDIYKTSEKGKKAFMDYIIKKELLIQEAKQLEIDKDKKFIAAIEKYWEATLIKLLMERKNTEIQNTTTISDNEIQKRYNEHKSKNENLPALNTIEKEIAAEILEEKKTKALENWIDDLHKNANIKVDEIIFTE